MRKTLIRTLGLSIATAAITMFAYGASAQEKKAAPAKKPPACTTMKVQADCTGRDDCTWTEEKKNKKGKVTAKAACKAKPKAKKK